MGYLYAALVGYLFGSLPFAYWFGLLQEKNILAEGTGNVGARNAWRSLGIVPGLMVLILDITKGLMAVALGEFLAKDITGGLIAGALAVWGHCYSILLFGRGGKGLATAAGVLIAVQPQILVAALIIFAVLYGLTRQMYRAILIVALVLPIITVMLVPTSAYFFFGLFTGIPIALRHWPDWNRIDQKS